MGGEGDRADVAGEGARRPRRRSLSRRGPQSRPRCSPAQPENDAADRGGRDYLRRVRLLRAGLPEPQPDDDAAPANRPAARDGAPARGLAAAADVAGGVRVRLARHLRRRRLVRPRLPTRDRHRPSGQGTAAQGTYRARRASGPRRGQALGRGRGRLARRPAPGRPPGAADEARPRAARARPRQAAVDPARRRRRRLRPLLHQPHLRRLAGRGHGRGFAPRRPTGLDPARCGRQLLRLAVELQRASARRTATRRTRWSSASGSGAGRGRCRS